MADPPQVFAPKSCPKDGFHIIGDPFLESRRPLICRNHYSPAGERIGNLVCRRPRFRSPQVGLRGKAADRLICRGVSPVRPIA